MKTAVKVLITLFLVLCVSGSLFAGGKTEQTKAASGPVVIEFWYGKSMTEAAGPPADWETLKLIEDKLGIKLVLNPQPSNPNDQTAAVQASAAANNLPDLFQVGRDTLQLIVPFGVVGQVDDLFAQMPNRSKIMYDQKAKDYVTFNGHSYGFPSPSAIVGNEGVLIRKDWLDKLGLKVPVTTEEYFAVMKAFTTQDPDGNGQNDTYGYGAFLEQSNPNSGLGTRFDPIMGAFGVAGTWDLSKASSGLTLHNPAYYDALAYIKRMVDEKVIDPNWVTYTKDDFRAAWKQGKFGIMREQNAAYAASNNYAPFDQNFPKGEWIVIDPPKGPVGKQAAGTIDQSYRIISVSQKAIAAGKGPAIAKLLEWMSSDEGYYLLGWGKEGVNWVKDAEGAPTGTGAPTPWDSAAFQPYTQLRNYVFYNGEKELVSRYPTYKTPSGRTMSALTVLYDMQNRAWTPNNGSGTMPAPNADVKRFFEQGVVEFAAGTRPLTQASWTAWVTQFDGMGGKAWETAGLDYAKVNSLLF